MILKGLTNNMPGVFRRSWAIGSIISMTGWLKSWARETHKHSASIPIPLRPCGASVLTGKPRARDAFRSCLALLREMIQRRNFFAQTALLSSALCFCVSNLSIAAPRLQQEKTDKRASARKKKPSVTPTKPPVASSLAEQQLERLPRDLHDHPMGIAYERLVQFARS